MYACSRLGRKQKNQVSVRIGLYRLGRKRKNIRKDRKIKEELTTSFLENEHYYRKTLRK